MSTVPPWRLLAWILNLLLIVNGGIFPVLLPTSVESQSTIDAEVKALKSIFGKLGLTSSIKWNTTKDPCSGVAVDESISIGSPSYNPFIKCDCTYNNNYTCHITELKIYALDVSGEIPDEIWTLTHLTNLNLAKNYLTGSISSSIGNLTKMQWLTFSTNALTGNLPKEIGKLTQLRSLGISTNYFSGPLPSELGNIDGLQQIYMDSSGFIGKIPQSFSNLVNMQTMWASDAEFNGSIPEFIGNWTQLTDLRLEGNSFVGSIPPSFSNLTALQILRIGDLSNGTSSLAFITNLKSLTTLVLRNIHFSDSIPTDIGGLSKLNYLDLSFNNISGKIPDSLFSLGSIYILFLGNNKLTGTLPSQKSSSLTNIDVSYNQLSGTIPSWMNSKTQLNLVANNFTGISNSALPSGINCLQNDFSCYLGNPRYSSFAVKCGGPEVKAFDETVFEKENEALGPSTYYLPDTNRWGVSNAGCFLFSTNASYVASAMGQLSNTLDPGLFHTARLSPGSLRYYGLGLEKGNYTVILQFAELVFDNGKTWKSLGRRVFDIYIQGNLALKDFDIRKAVGGVSFSVVKRNFNATVTSNHLEIHLLWAGKGTCCIPAQGSYGPSISAISITPNFVPTVSNKPPSGLTKNKLILIMAISLPIGCICLFLACCCTIQTSTRLLEAPNEGATARNARVICILDCFWFYQILKRRKVKRQRAKNFARNGGLLLQEMASGDCIAEKTKVFTARELEKATDCFKISRILGQGVQGTVYKGILIDGRIVTIKKSNIVKEDECHQFINEVVILSHVNHGNVVKLLGCCLETDVPLLVYEFVPNDTLCHHLHGPNEDFHITWRMRLQIAAESAGALAYIHSLSPVPIHHRDVKSSNILLDEKYRAKVSNFGISRTITIDEQTPLGTMGYLDPEYLLTHQFNDKSDVYSFGVLLLELITGTKPIMTTNSGDKKVLVTEFLRMMEVGGLNDILDPRIVEEAKEEEVLAVSNLAIRCLNMNYKQRPTMKEVAMIMESV